MFRDCLSDIKPNGYNEKYYKEFCWAYITLSNRLNKISNIKFQTYFIDNYYSSGKKLLDAIFRIVIY